MYYIFDLETEELLATVKANLPPCGGVQMERLVLQTLLQKYESEGRLVQFIAW